MVFTTLTAAGLTDENMAAAAHCSTAALVAYRTGKSDLRVSSRRSLLDLAYLCSRAADVLDVHTWLFEPVAGETTRFDEYCRGHADRLEASLELARMSVA